MPGLVHGDYGPQNLLLEVAPWKVSALLDWEFAHAGDPIEDLAWAEWIVRMHHTDAVGALSALFVDVGGPATTRPCARTVQLRPLGRARPPRTGASALRLR